MRPVKKAELIDVFIGKETELAYWVLDLQKGYRAGRAEGKPTRILGGRKSQLGVKGAKCP